MWTNPRLWILLAGLFPLSVGPAVGQQKRTVPDDPPSVIEEGRRFKDVLVRLEKEYETELARRVRLRELRAMSDADVDETRLGLARARLNRAIGEGDSDAAREQLNAVVEIRERELARVQALQQMSSVSPYEVKGAQRRLAYARFLLARQDGRSDDALREMRDVARFCEEELKTLSNVREVVAGWELELTEYRLANARYCLARQEGRSDDAVRDLRTAIEMGELMLRRAERLHRGSVLPLQEEFIRKGIHFARLRLAIAEKKPDEVREQLRKTLIEDEAIGRRLRADPAAMSALEKAWITHDFALFRLRYAMAAEGVELPDVDAWNLLDY